MRSRRDVIWRLWIADRGLRIGKWRVEYAVCFRRRHTSLRNRQPLGVFEATIHDPRSAIHNRSMSSALVAAVSLLAAQGYHPKGPKIEVELTGHRTFIISTDTKGSPKTVKGILKLVREGFYDGQRFHRVEDWVVQWGDPQSRTLPMGDSRL